MQRMIDFCQLVSMSRLFETLERRVFQYPTLRNLTEKGGCSLWSRPLVPCMGFLRDTSVHWTFLTTSRHSSNKFGSALDFASLLRFSLFKAVKKQSYIKLEPILLKAMSSTDTSAGDTPLIREACPMVRGCILFSFSRASYESD